MGFVRTALLAGLMALALPAAAAADSGSMAQAGTGRLASVAYKVTADSCPASGTCGWYGYATSVGATDSCDPAGSIAWAGSYTVGQTTETDSAPLYEAGQRRLCLWIKRNERAAELVAEQVVGAAPRVPVDHAEPMTSRNGGAGLTIRISLRRLPDRVGPKRFVDVVTRSAERWGIGVAGLTSRRLAMRRKLADGVSVIGFSSRVDSDTLGQEMLYVGRGRVLDDDIALNARKVWQEGPAYPSGDEFDLETIVIHELGHMAGNDHAANCENSPMSEAFLRGDWWRAPDDWSRASCGD